MEVTVEKYIKAKEFKQKKTYECFFCGISVQYNICIFGIGALGKQIGKWLLNNGIQVKFFCDNNEAMHGVEIVDGIVCISPQELWQYRDEVYIIVGVGNQKWNIEINEQLKEFPNIMRNPLGIVTYWQQTFDISAQEFINGINDTKEILEDAASVKTFEILTELRMQDCVVDYPLTILNDFFYKQQYIVKEIIDYNKINTYVDCGAYLGDSLREFIQVGADAEYYCFEMDADIYKELRKNVKEFKDKAEKIHLYPYGVGETRERVTYISDNTGGSCMDSEGEQWADIVTLDSIHFQKKIDFIKMDIEGAEEEAIKGAETLIKRDHPILAISIYHNFSQFVNIVKNIKNIDSRYHIYIRHHKYTLDDTVCYAVYK